MSWIRGIRDRDVHSGTTRTKTSNYTNHLTNTPLDEAFEQEKLEFAAV